MTTGDCPNVFINTAYNAPQWVTTPLSEISLLPHTDPNINSANLKNIFYMISDISYTYSPTTCITGATYCPSYTVTCYPPYDWSPKQYNFNLITDPSPSTYAAPSVIDCLGR